jgi:hypothetical protein
VGSVLFRDPNLGIAGASADPHAEDPFAAALGMDLPKWREEPGAPASRMPAVEAVAPGPADETTASEPLAPTERRAVVDQPGPSDPADRD